MSVDVAVVRSESRRRRCVGGGTLNDDTITRSVTTAVVVVAVVVVVVVVMVVVGVVVVAGCRCQCNRRGRRATGNLRPGSHRTRRPRYSNNTRPHTTTLDARGHGTARPVSRRTAVDVDSGRCGAAAAAASCRWALALARARASVRTLDVGWARPPRRGRGGEDTGCRSILDAIRVAARACVWATTTNIIQLCVRVQTDIVFYRETQYIVYIPIYSADCFNDIVL